MFLPLSLGIIRFSIPPPSCQSCPGGRIEFCRGGRSEFCRGGQKFFSRPSGASLPHLIFFLPPLKCISAPAKISPAHATASTLKNPTHFNIFLAFQKPNIYILFTHPNRIFFSMLLNLLYILYTQ